MNRITLLLKGLLLYPQFSLLFFHAILITVLVYIQKNRKPIITRETTLSTLVESYKIGDLRKTVALIIIYFGITIGLIFVLRILNIGYSKALFNINISLPFINLLILASFLILLGLVRNIFYEDLLKKMFKLYLYFLTLDQGKRFIEFIFDKYHDSKGNHYITKTYLFFTNIRPDHEIPSFVINLYDNFNHIISLETIYYLRNKLQQSPTVYTVVHLLYRIASLLHDYWWPFRYYSIYFLLFCIILYDLIQEVIYYTYFILPIFMLITLYRKLLSFIGTKDFYVLDPLLVAYLYENKCSLDALENYEANIREYLFNGYRGEHASYFFTEKTPSIEPSFIIIKRLYLLFLVCITSWVLLFNMTLTHTILLTLPLVLAFNTMEFHYTIIVESKKLFKKMVFNMSIVSMILINLWVYLTRHNHAYVRDIIWNKGVIIKQTFTIEEKTDFLYKYLNYTLDKLTDMSEEVKGIVLSKITDADLLSSLTENTTIQQIRDFVELLPFAYLRLEAFYNQQFIEIFSKAKELAYEDFDNELTRIWSDRIDKVAVLFLILYSGITQYMYFTNKSTSAPRFIDTERSIAIFIKYIKALFDSIINNSNP